MSIVNNVEKSYLDLLRVVVLVVATILLILSLIAGLSGGLGFFNFGDGVVSPEKVTVDEVIQDLAPRPQEVNKPAEKSQVDQKKVDPFQDKYEKIVERISLFVKANSKESINKDAAIEFISKNTNRYDDPLIRESYINGLSDTVDQAFKSDIVVSRLKTVDKVAPSKVEAVPASAAEGEEVAPVPEAQDLKIKKESPIDISIEVIEKYTEHFNAKIAVANEETAKNQAEKALNKAGSLIKLYVAGAAFFLFLLVVFVSILIKIERNLRVIADKP